MGCFRILTIAALTFSWTAFAAPQLDEDEESFNEAPLVPLLNPLAAPAAQATKPLAAPPAQQSAPRGQAAAATPAQGRNPTPSPEAPKPARSSAAVPSANPSRAAAASLPESDKPRGSADALPATASIQALSPPSSSPRARAAAASRLDELNLSSSQTAAILAMRRDWKNDEEGRIKENLRQAKRELYEAMSDTSDAPEVQKKFERVQRHYIELQSLKFEKSLKIREILSPDQRKKFQELRIRSES